MTELVKTTKRKATTKAGKGVRALNSLRHGIQAKSVLPSEQAEYALHQNALHASLEPHGYLEERLTDRVALTLWRLTRLETWEASLLTERHRRAWESALFRDSALSRLIDSLSNSGTLEYREVSSLNLQETFKELERFAYGSPAELLRDWADTALHAQTLLEGAEQLTRFYVAGGDTQPEVTDAMLLALTPEACSPLTTTLDETLKQWGVTAETICKAALGDAYEPGHAESYEVGDWEWEAAELPGLWRLYADEHAQRDDVISAPHLVAYRKGCELKQDGKRILELGDRARVLLTEEQNHAVMLSEKDVQKVQRYEGHLERVLYRALHELEAMKDRRNGKQAPLARVEVHGDSAE
jgi:hypothetical protein